MSDEPAAVSGENPFQSPTSPPGEIAPAQPPLPVLGYWLTVIATIGCLAPLPGPPPIPGLVMLTTMSAAIPGFVLCAISYRRRRRLLTGVALALSMLICLALLSAIGSMIAVYQASRYAQPY